MADVKITALPARVAIATTDILPVVDAASGTPATQKATVAQVRAALMPVLLTADVSGVLPSANAPSHAGDVTGAHAATVVAKINGTTVATAGGALTTGVVLRATGVATVDYGAVDLANAAAVTGVLPSGNAPSHAGDVTGTHAATVVAKVNGTTYPAGGALTTGTVPRVTGVATVAYGALDLANASAVTGVLPVGNQASQAMAGDVTGTTAASVVAKVNGAAIATAAGALVTDKVLRVTGISAADWGALNLAASAAVTGVLPTANQAAQAMAGDVTGTTAASVVAKVNGATAPAAGALTTGNSLHVTGISALGYSSLNLAGGAGWVTGVLPAANATQATGTGFPHTTLGVLDTASKKVDLSATADVAFSGAATNGVVTAASAGFLQTATNVIAGSNFLSVGGTPAAAGLIRVPNNVGAMISVRDNTNATDWNIVKSTGVAAFTWGDANANQTFTSFTMSLNAASGQSIDTAIGSAFCILFTGSSIQAAQPIIGDNRGASPYGVHGRMPLRALAAATTYTVLATEYSFQVLQFSSSTASACTITLPSPATEAGSYFKDIDVTQCNVSQGVIFTCGAGTRTASITGGGAAVPGVPKRIFVSPNCVDLAPG